jgi:hypothetical protein
MKDSEKEEIIKIIKEEVCNVRRGIQGRIEVMIDEFKRLRKEQNKINKSAAKNVESIAKFLEKNVNINEQLELSASQILLAIHQREYLQEWIPKREDTEIKA